MGLPSVPMRTRIGLKLLSWGHVGNRYGRLSGQLVTNVLFLLSDISLERSIRRETKFALETRFLRITSADLAQFLGESRGDRELGYGLHPKILSSRVDFQKHMAT